MIAKEELSKIVDDITQRFKSLGKKVFTVNIKVQESSGTNGFAGGECVPMGSAKDGKTIFIDPDAYKELTKESAYIFLPHELAHCFSFANHEDFKFEEYMEDYNDYFKPESPVDPDDSYVTKYFPLFHKKDKAYDKAKTSEEWEQALKNRNWNIQENYFDY